MDNSLGNGLDNSLSNDPNDPEQLPYPRKN